MKHLFKYFLAAFVLGFTLSACHKDLDKAPKNSKTPDEVYATPEGYRMAFAKVYGAYAMTGNAGSGSGDIQGIDYGTSDFFRLFWNAQELPTDEAVVAWGDAGIQDFHNMNWSSSNPFLTGLYYRAMYQITLANDFIRQASDENVAARGIKGADADAIKLYRAEARFLRALQYWVLMDLYGNPPFIIDTDPIGTIPQQIARKDLFAFLESELKALDAELAAPKSNEYGRADQAAAWALLARMYLNAEVYTGQPRYNDAVTYASKVIAAPYKLIEDYRWLMLADNHKNTDEFIMTINYDGLKTQSFGGTTFLTHAAVGGDMNAGDFGINGGWGGIRTTRALTDLFPDVSGAADQRAQFHTSGQTLEIENQSEFTQGYAVRKFRNVTRSGEKGQSLDYADVDIPLFRLAEMYLVYAEAVLRGGTGGDAATALGYINKLRERAYQNTSGNIAAVEMTLDFILDERARELYWEGFRRTDLIRYDRFTTGTYLWPWKGGVQSGTAVSSYRNLFPLPSQDLSANIQLDQNPGY